MSSVFVETHDSFDRFAALLNCDIILTDRSSRSRCWRLRGGCCNQRVLAMCAEHKQKAGHHGGIGDVKVSAVGHRFFHAIGQVAERTNRALTRHCHRWTKAVLDNDDINILCFQSPK